LGENQRNRFTITDQHNAKSVTVAKERHHRRLHEARDASRPPIP